MNSETHSDHSSHSGEAAHAHGAASHTHTPHPAEPTSYHTPKKENSLPLIPIAIVLILILAGAFYFLQPKAAPTPGPTDTAPVVVASDDQVIADPTANDISFTDRVERNESLKRTLTKAKYTIELYRIDRSTYRLFESAAQFTNSTLDEINAFFFNCCDLTSEQDIFSELPPIPKDFSTVAYDIATGSLLQLGQITKDYYLQPEFYFNVGETAGSNRRIAFRGWAQPELEYWGDNGYLSYPNQQWGTVQKNNENLARAVVFYSAGWNIQNYQGLMLVPDAKSRELFDIEIQADSTGQPYFLLSPTFPKFYNNWAEKVTITVRAKPGTPPGQYTIGINPATPPNAVNIKWAGEHKGLYFSGRGSIAPEGNQIDLIIDVQ